jgi:hypothetical protein
VSCDALALGAIANVTVIDRETGAALPTHYFHGDYWVAGTPGARYAIDIRNCAGGRVLAVTSVDGVNVISGASASWDQSGYVFDPGESYQITGWRKTDAEVAAFTFTESPDSYAERTGRPANIGIIGVALFRERPPQAPKIAALAGAPLTREAAESARSSTSPAAASAPRDLSSAAPADETRAAVAAPKLGTAHGEREYSHVENTQFQRMQGEPNELIRIRYDSLEHLVALGIVRRPHHLTSAPNPFPGSPQRQFVPDPPG